jgi:hypothetical protein
MGEDTYEALATTLSGEERERCWAALQQSYPFFADHEAKSARTIPVVALSRA